VFTVGMSMPDSMIVGAHQHVIVAFPEVDCTTVRACLRPSGRGRRDARLGHEFAQAVRGGVDRLHPVVHPEHLAFTQQLAADRLDATRSSYGPT
jgi:hypothetical protein